MRQAGKRVKERYFATAEAAHELARNWMNEIGRSGVVAASSISEGDVRFLMQSRQSLGTHGRQLEDAVKFYLAHLERCKTSITVELLADKFLTYKSKEGLSVRYLTDLEFRLKTFVQSFGHRMAADVTTEEISQWLMKLKLSPVSVGNYRRAISVLFSYAVSLKAVDADKHPAKGAFRPKTVEKEIGFLSVPQASALLLAASQEPTILPAIAVGLFAGVRSAELARLDWKDISLTRGYISISARNAKTGVKRKIQILPVLKSWLEPLQSLSGPVYPEKARGIRGLMQRTKTLAGFGTGNPWPANALRHSFGSYHAAMFQNVPALSLEMGNSPAMVDKHYRNAEVEKADAINFWNLTRERVLAPARVVSLPKTIPTSRSAKP